jgi:hypothetical protein
MKDYTDIFKWYTTGIFCSVYVIKGSAVSMRGLDGLIVV